MEKTPLSIVIPVFNKSNFTLACLKDLFQLPADHQIIVIDNASTDDTQRELSAIQRSNFHYVRNATNLGFGKACNIGYANSTGRHVMFLNNDIRVKNNHNGWTQPILDLLDREPKCLTGPTGAFVDPKTFHFAYETADPSKPINYLSGWCLSASRATWEQLTQAENGKGPFCEDFFCFFEDCHLSWVATRIGINLKLIEVPVTHFGHMSSKQLNTAKLYGEARQVFLSKWSKQ